ncbi:MAG TPA: histidine--tRNA ligase [Candidatus Coprenecus stercoravium]|uniref:Histidine--tRNA ligase n=1 Tax=Candidatus Coprenecus stercoravium TaxID=2840735 RepID=A0A9D2GR92_9BACT|nr:histidine--tRNA ligase [Candidatus Coprenecus stercoravium]
MAQKPSIPKGTRDFGPAEMAGRDYIFNTVKSIFRKYGYSPIETPAMENLSTLLGKYGEEGDKLLFKILNSGDAFQDIRDMSSSNFAGTNSNALALKVCEKGLRYDLTVPFARYVVQHRNELTFPFKRYQIQPVWRADRPQKGRYREFYQCDVDVIGSDSLLNELEMVQIADEVFKALDIRVRIKINNRKVLAGLAEITGQADKLTDITVAIDKIDKIGLDAVKEELAERGLLPESIARIEPVLTLSGDNSSKISSMRLLLKDSVVGLCGLDELETLFGLIKSAGITTETEFDLSLARGLNYYTGAIFEVKALDFAIGSICGGGRYDNLTGIFGLPDTSGVGISFGADRIYDVLLGLDKFPQDAVQGTEYLFANMGSNELPYIIKSAAMCRAAGHSAEIYPEPAKLRKQFEYADKKGIKYVIIAGDEEIQNNELSIKNMQDGSQKRVKISDIF